MPRNQWKQFLKDPHNKALALIALLGITSMLGHAIYALYWR